MAERTAYIETKSGRMETFVVHPDGKGPFAGIVVFQNIGGLGDILRTMARRVAAQGYYCAVPDLYYRLGRIVIDADNREPEAVALRNAASVTLHNSARIMEDTDAVLKFMDQDPFVAKGYRGCVGFSIGGRIAPIAAATFPDAFRATSSLFGMRLFGDEPDSPQATVSKIRGEIYFGFAENDHAMSLDDVEKWRALYKAKCLGKWSMEVHPGTEHGFAFPGRRVYHHDAAELSWQRTFEMFKRQLT